MPIKCQPPDKLELKKIGESRERYYAHLIAAREARSSEEPWEDLYARLMGDEEQSLSPRALLVLRYLQARRNRSTA